jgi:hypothetical protein
MIRLLTVIGHGTNLIKHHIKHYSRYVNQINYVVYDTDKTPKLSQEVQEIIKDFDNVKIVRTHFDRIFDWERVTMLYNYIINKEPNDWWVIADIDEFHLYPNNNLNDLIQNCEKNGWDIVRGGFIDRIGPNGEFSELDYNENIFKQFPNAGFFRYPLSGANPNKICVTKGYVEITSGQHYAKINNHTTWRWQGWNHPLINPNNHIQVHHFKWDSTSIDRIKSVADNKQEYSYSDEYGIMYKSLRKNKFRININDPLFLFEKNCILGDYGEYSTWDNLINKIKSI